MNSACHRPISTGPAALKTHPDDSTWTDEVQGGEGRGADRHDYYAGIQQLHVPVKRHQEIQPRVPKVPTQNHTRCESLVFRILLLCETPRHTDPANIFCASSGHIECTIRFIRPEGPSSEPARRPCDPRLLSQNGGGGDGRTVPTRSNRNQQ